MENKKDKRPEFDNSPWPNKWVKYTQSPYIGLQCAVCLFKIYAPSGITDLEQALMDNHVCLKTDGTEWTLTEAAVLVELIDDMDIQGEAEWIRVRKERGIDTF